MTTDNPSLRECPFCGEEALVSSDLNEEGEGSGVWSVGCSCTAYVGPWATEAEAIAAWNHRATPLPQQGLVAESRSFTEDFSYDINMVRGLMRRMAAELERLYAERGGE